MKNVDDEYIKKLVDFFMNQIEQKIISDLFCNDFKLSQNEVVSYMISKGDLKFHVRDFISFYLWADRKSVV